MASASTATSRLQHEVNEDESLPFLFQQALELCSRLDSSGLSSEEIDRAVSLLQRCHDLVGKLGVFSPNEEKEDISTTDLKYLLVPFYLAEVSERLPSVDRLQVIEIVQGHLLTFLMSGGRFGFLPERELQSLSREVPLDAETRRAEKIARFRRQREAEAKLQEVRQRKERRRRSTQAATKTSAAELGEDDSVYEDEEEDREAWLMQISLSLYKALDLLETLQRERGMLAAVQASGEELISKAVLDERLARAETWHREASKAKSKPAQPISCATFAQDVIEGRASLQGGHSHDRVPVFGPASMVTGNITTERERLVAQVFQPSHSLPSMSIEQAGEREMAIMNKWNERNAKLAREANSSWVDEKKDNDSDDEAAEYKARAWDDWKDEHPKGAGNKKLTPCG